MDALKSKRLAALATVVAVTIAIPLAVVAAGTFTDVTESNIHHEDIDWLAETGITRGCNPPQNTQYCPKDPVLRDQMATFLRRMANHVQVWATVHHNGSLVRGGGATGSDKVGSSQFSYEVEFDRDVSACGYAVTMTEITGGDSVGMASASPMVGNENAVHVVTRDFEGSGAARSFNLTVTC